MKKISLLIALTSTLLLGVLLGVKLQKEVRVSAVEVAEIEGVFRLMEAKYHTKIDRSKLLQKTIDRVKRENEIDSIYQPSERLKRINEHIDIRPPRGR